VAAGIDKASSGPSDRRGDCSVHNERFMSSLSPSVAVSECVREVGEVGDDDGSRAERCWLLCWEHLRGKAGENVDGEVTGVATCGEDGAFHRAGFVSDESHERRGALAGRPVRSLSQFCLPVLELFPSWSS
jgi:hypothetical protein